MGGRGSFLESGGFSHQEYRRARDPIAGIKVLRHIGDPHKGLPEFCNTPNTMYLREDGMGNITQLRLYKDRKPFLDVDWGHNHGDFKKGIPHVQEWHESSDECFVRSSTTRALSSSERKRFNDVFRALGVRMEFAR